LNYWQFGDYLGLGAGAHGKVTLRDAGGLARRAKTRNPRTYLQRAGGADSVAHELVAAPRQAALEFLMNALRLVDGVPVEIFSARAGQPVSRLDVPRAMAVERGWLDAGVARLQATPMGLERLNKLLEMFC
jgi:oxygen-independent coproporphyrinogen-3 oxidase